MELVINDKVAEVLVENIRVYQELDPTDDDEFAEMGRRLSAISMMFDDILFISGLREELTEIEEKLRTANPYHVSILPTEGRNP